MVDYFEYVSEKSDLVTYLSYGKTYEGNPLTHAIITDPENQKKIKDIKSHESDIPIVWLSYNVHGNETSSTESALAMLYALAANKPIKGTENDWPFDTKEWLKNVVIILDPCLNPNGRERYVNWFRQKKGAKINTDVMSWQHQELHPNGRSNQYYLQMHCFVIT